MFDEEIYKKYQSVYALLMPIDCICTTSSSLFAKVIRLVTSKKVDLKPIKEVFRNQLATHCGLVVKQDNMLKIAEMLNTGLEINMISDYFHGNSTNRVVAVRRLMLLTEAEADLLNEQIMSIYYTNTVDYSYDELLNFLKLKRNVPGKMYCSEFCEIVANMSNFTWSNFELKNRSKPASIAPCQIQYGRGGKIYDAFS